MGQFDVHANPGRLTREAMPFLLDVQSNFFRSQPRRLVVPLIRKTLLRTTDPAIHKVFEIEGVAVLLNPLDMTTVPVDRLGRSVGSLAHRADDIIAAIDWVISRAFD
ncbi:CcdB family protein [Caenispirillum bisanense]|uniref:Toxin CcdB n=1 Tax=Caenispirillum bisanense TaxID=414052 RepID=A0A286GNQ2_9PROT|nr:CcdB family protein [Caenispirillum bisanense]SOD97158.1 toxin CcdB [Caenispirillum bisanense]